MVEMHVFEGERKVSLEKLFNSAIMKSSVKGRSNASFGKPRQHAILIVSLDLGEKARVDSDQDGPSLCRADNKQDIGKTST